MPKILLVLSGGTICTAVHDEGGIQIRSIFGGADLLLKKNFEKSGSMFVGRVEFVSSKNFHILSENMSVEKWNDLICYFREHAGQWKDYDGVVIAHGTDTLAYSAALFSLILCRIGIPVFLVSSNEPLTSSGANGNENFKAAVECICMGIQPNVYVTYKNISDSRMYLHLASRLTQCRNYEEDFFSGGAVDISSLSWKNCRHLFCKLPIGLKRTETVIDLCGNWYLSECVLRIEPYVGLNYESFRYSEFQAILHGTYHSGTVCAGNVGDTGYDRYCIRTLLDRCADGPEVYISPAKLEGEVYDTVPVIANHLVNGKRVRFLYGYTNEMAYVKLLLAYSVRKFQNEFDVDGFLQNEYNAERIH